MASAAVATPSGGTAMETDGLKFLLDPVDRFPLREEFTDNLEHPDHVSLALLSPREDALSADSSCGSRCAHRVGGWAVYRRVPLEEKCLADPVCAIHWEVESRSPRMDEEGKPEVENSRPCRCVCSALIRLLRASENSWYITKHCENHNHSMSLTMGEKVHCPSHKHIDVYTNDMIKQLQENNVNLVKVYSIIGSFFGSIEKVPFKDFKEYMWTNLYDMPFVLFVGVNNHFSTIILAGVLMRDEQGESFQWVFAEFLRMMGGPAPKTILTDQNRDMEVAISKVCPDIVSPVLQVAYLKKAKESLGPLYTMKNEFRPEFHKVVYHTLTVDKFKAAWDMLPDKYNLRNHSYMSQT